ncbi:hypothetical protein B0H34DRAFT_719487 [Crassisporium funariophilum]|nr:hypothetical protein B0H34DRAFT_719487 [Crassisporium funariophilum]
MQLSPRDGRNLTFVQLVKAMVLVYNISYPLAFAVTLGGFVTSGKLSYHDAAKPMYRQKSSLVALEQASWKARCIALIEPMRTLVTYVHLSWTLDLSSLSKRGPYRIAHDGAMVHLSGISSTAPDKDLIKKLLDHASNVRDAAGKLKGGLGLADIAHYHAQRQNSLTSPNNDIQEQVALGECGLLWSVLRGREHAACQGPGVCENDAVVPTSRLEQWLGEERLPDGWWGEDGVRPRTTIGLFQSRQTADKVGVLGKTIA